MKIVFARLALLEIAHFRETGETIVVVAFAHKKKRPGYWSRRFRAAP